MALPYGAWARRFDGSSYKEHRVCDAERKARCHEGQCEEYQVNACHVHYYLGDLEK
jgi:hypothetical protein